jgi:hypothetical protein
MMAQWGEHLRTTRHASSPTNLQHVADACGAVPTWLRVTRARVHDLPLGERDTGSPPSPATATTTSKLSKPNARPSKTPAAARQRPVPARRTPHALGLLVQAPAPCRKSSPPRSTSSASTGPRSSKPPSCSPSPKPPPASSQHWPSTPAPAPAATPPPAPERLKTWHPLL